MLEKYRLLLIAHFSAFSCLSHHLGPAAQLCTLMPSLFPFPCKNRYEMISHEILKAHFLKYCPGCPDMDNNSWLLRTIQSWLHLS